MNAVVSRIAVRVQKWFRVFPSLLFAQLVLVGSVLDAQADDASTDGGAGSDWKFSVSPYLWAAGISGKASALPGLPPVDSELISATIGYRWMKVDRDNDGFLYDVTQEGIMAGLTFRF